jgi:hypothetical protein
MQIIPTFQINLLLLLQTTTLKNETADCSEMLVVFIFLELVLHRKNDAVYNKYFSTGLPTVKI